MKKRSLGKMIVLFIVTFGIYRLYWLAKTRKELVKKTRLSIPSVWLLILPYILVVSACVVLIFASISAESSREDRYISCLAQRPGLTLTCEHEADEPTGAESVSIVGMYGTMMLVLPFTGWWYWMYAQAFEKATKGKMSFPIGMLILVAVPDGFDMLIMQDTLNKTK